MSDPVRYCALAVLAAIVPLSGCGGGSARTGAASTPSSTQAPPPPVQPPPPAPASGPGPLQGEAAQAAAGDIPDNQVFVEFGDRFFALKVPEGWPQTGGGRRVTFRDKNNIVRVVVVNGPPPTPASAGRELARLPGVRVVRAPLRIELAHTPAVKVVYATTSAPNPVTGKRVTLVVDRYELGHRGRRAILDLGTPEGVDNVDAYRLMSESFRLK